MSSELEPEEGDAEAVPGGLVIPCLPAGPLIDHFKEEDEDVHRCGRCQAEFTSLEEFVQHQIQKACQRDLDESFESSISVLSSQEVVPCIEEDDVDISHVVVETSSLQEMSSSPDSGTAPHQHLMSHQDPAVGLLHLFPISAISEEVKIVSSEDSMVGIQRGDLQGMEVDWQEGPEVPIQTDESHLVKMIVDERGRFICQTCEKTFKSCTILKAHMLTHSSSKDFQCKLCADSFRTKGSLIRHIRRHTDERPYGCSKCGKSFRESGALSRHMRSLTPCTEKISHVMGNSIVLKRDENSSVLVSTDVTSHLGTDELDGSPVIQLVTDEKGNLLHEIHVQVRAVAFKTGIDGIMNKDAEDLQCPECGEICKSVNSLKVHLKGHEGCKLFRCDECGREFLKAHMLKKHQESHGNIRKYRCGECGKMYKTIAHVKGHMRVHSDDRPYSCPKCGKKYKTKNAQQVHLRTHMEDKPYVCQYCPHSFREKGSLVRHIRHHTGEKPFKCPRCGRGFAEHGTLNRHMKTKGGCMIFQLDTDQTEQTATENSSSSEAMSSTTASEEPHTMLVEFSSVVADTQEYIIETSEEIETTEAAELLQSTGTQEVDGRILNVVQHLVRSANSGQRIIVQNVTLDDDDTTEPCIEEVPTTDTITIATPESLTEQVALTLASAIGDGAVIANELSPVEEVIAAEDVEQVEEFVIAAQTGEVEVQTVIV
ncbi:transcription factor E4F1 isoform X2 [Ranitomeya imitator]|uniref:transcription factor E4F1 isoform X2 n=1 Tax=Ranitomeya imitator TaxID=111125 RepID=UPI0037E797CC